MSSSETTKKDGEKSFYCIVRALVFVFSVPTAY
jgi:hypothetical protein